MNAATMKLLYLVVLMGCCGQGSAQIQSCHNATGCGGSEVNVSSARECCLGSGLSFQDQSSRCRQCIVHGFVQTTDFVINEGAAQEVIRMMMDVKGDTRSEPSSTRVLNFGFSFTCIDSSNGGGPMAVDLDDFTNTGCGSNIQLQLFPSVQSRSEVGISAVADDKIEGTEVLILRLMLTNATQTDVNNAGNIFLQDTLNIRVTDVTAVVIGFRADDYTGDEGDVWRPNTPCTVTVEIIERTLQIPLQIKLTPREQSATRMDFNDTVILTEVPAAQTQLVQTIQIFDDEINEGREVFNVSLEVVGNISNTVEYRIQTTLCRIRESDPIEIGFTQRRINHTEEAFRQFETPISKSRASEQTFIVQVELSTLNSPFGQSATRGEDFEITGSVLPIVLMKIQPSEPNEFFSYEIIGDNTPENLEVFQLTITPAIGSPTFTCTEDNGCFQQLEIVIVDDDVVVVGFVDTLVEVNEADGQATLNVSIISPIPIPGIVELRIMFSLRVDSLDGSAASHSAIDKSRNPIPGIEDFPRIVDGIYYTFREMPFQFRVLDQMFNGIRRSQTFTFPIFMDDVPEGVEELQLALSVRPDPQLPEGSVNVTPAVATVRIQDFSSVVVGFERHTYTVGEGDGQVELCVNITVPRRQDIGTVTFNLTVETQNGSAVSNDDYTSVSMTLDTFTSQHPRQCFNISITNDAIIEQTEVFTTRLTLIPASVTTINASRIIVDPPETTVQIIDNDYEIVVGYNRTYVNVFEADGRAELIVSIIVPAQADLFENSFYLLVNTQDGTATAPSDYGNLTNFRLGPFNDDVHQLSFNVSIVNDNITEDAETFSVSLTLDSAVRVELVGNVTVLPAVATATIVDNDVIVVGYIQTTVTVLESEGLAQLQLTVAILAAQLDASFSLLVNTSDGTATAPGDYGSLTNFCVGPFNNSVHQLSFNVSIVNDNSTEDAEMFTASLTLDPADQARLGNRVTVSPDAATVTIQDDEAITVGYVQTAVNVYESDGVATLTVAISVPLGADPIETLFFLLVNTLDETATTTAPSDFGNLTNFRLGPFNNDVRQLSFNMSIVDDSIPEDEETFNVSLTLDPADQARLGNRMTVSPDVATVTIQDNDDIIVGYSVANMTALESDGMATLTVVVTTPIETSFFLLVNTLDGAATAPSDYGNLTNFSLGPFNNDVHKLSFNVPVMNDNIPEDAEMFNVSLTFDIADQGNRIIVSPNIAMVTIKDNDVITVGYTVTDVTASESDGVATLTVVVTLPPEDVPIETFFTLSVNTLDGTATAPSDYGNLTNFPLGPFNNSVRRLSFTVSIVDDSILEDAETFNASLTLDPADQDRLGNRATVSPDVATLTIQDNDEITVGYTVTDRTVSESDGKAQLTVVVTMPTGADPIETFFSLIVNTSYGTATAPSDYGALNNFCLGPFNNDVRQLSFNVSIVNDNIPEDDKMFRARLTLDPADQARLGNRVIVSPDVATITIQDDDAITVGYVETAMNVSESDGVAQLTVAISMPSEDVPIETSFSLLVNTTGVPFYMRRNTTADNRAAAFCDYSPLTNFSLDPFNNDTRELSFNVSIVNDNSPERTEIFYVHFTLDPADQARLGDRVTVSPVEATVTIQDNDEITVGYNQTAVTVSESDGVAQLTVKILMPHEDVPIDSEVSFSLVVNTSDGTATAPSDYGNLTNFRLDQFSNDVRELSFNVCIVDNSIRDGDRTFSVILTLNSAGQDRRVTVSPNVATVMIRDEIVVGYVQPSGTVIESDGVAQLTVKILMPHEDVPIDSEVSFSLVVNTSDGTATAPSDYGNLTNFRLDQFSNDVRELSFNVCIVDNSIRDGDRTFSVILTLNSAGQDRRVTVSPNVATVMIRDDEIVVGYVQPSGTVIESDGVAQLTVNTSMLSGAVPIEMSFSLLVNTSDGTAIAPGDYGNLTDFRLCTISDDMHQLSLNVSIVNDNITEDAETFSVSLTLDPAAQARLGNRVIVSPDVINVTIQDDDEIKVGYNQTAVNVSENDGVATLTIAILMPPEADPIETSFNLLVNTMDGSATTTAPVDYGNLTNFYLGPFNNDVRQLSFNVSIVDDSIPEDVEMFNVSLILDPADQDRLDNRVTVSPDVATVTIQDDDEPTPQLSTSSSVSYSVTQSSLQTAGPTQVDVGVILGSTFAAMVVLILCIGIAIVAVVYLRRKQHAKKVDLRRIDEMKEMNPYIAQGSQVTHGPYTDVPKLLISSSSVRLLNVVGQDCQLTSRYCCEFGVVYKAHLVKSMQQMPEIVAVKTLKGFFDRKSAADMMKESEKMQGFEHPHVLNITGVCVDAGPAPYIIMPFMANGSLLAYIKKEKMNVVIPIDAADEELATVARKRLADMCIQIGKGMEYLASKKIVHRDLAARNCMIDAHFVIKVADFGLSENMYSKTYFRQEKDHSIKLPVKWLALEALTEGVFSEKSDVWSYGVTCWELFTGGRVPYPGVDPVSLPHLLESGHRLDKPNNAACSEEIYLFMLKCWHGDPEERPTFSELVSLISQTLESLAGYMDVSTFGKLEEVHGEDPHDENTHDEGTNDEDQHGEGTDDKDTHGEGTHGEDLHCETEV